MTCDVNIASHHPLFNETHIDTTVVYRTMVARLLMVGCPGFFGVQDSWLMVPRAYGQSPPEADFKFPAFKL